MYCYFLLLHRSNAVGSEDDSIEDHYRVNIFYPTLDEVCGDIRSRFGEKQILAANFCRAIPGFMKFNEEDWTLLQRAVILYQGMFTDPMAIVKAEYELWKTKWLNQRSARPQTALAALEHAQMFPNISILLKILATLPISTAEAERCFSKLERTLTAVRASMEEGRLESLLLLQIHRDFTPSIDSVINRFAAVSARRLKFVL